MKSFYFTRNQYTPNTFNKRIQRKINKYVVTIITAIDSFTGARIIKQNERKQTKKKIQKIFQTNASIRRFCIFYINIYV